MRSTSLRASKTNIRNVLASEVSAFLTLAQPVKYNPFIPDPQYPQDYLDDIVNNPDDHDPLDAPSIDDCEAWATTVGYAGTWTAEGKRMNEGLDPESGVLWLHCRRPRRKLP